MLLRYEQSCPSACAPVPANILTPRSCRVSVEKNNLQAINRNMFQSVIPNAQVVIVPYEPQKPEEYVALIRLPPFDSVRVFDNVRVRPCGRCDRVCHVWRVGTRCSHLSYTLERVDLASPPHPLNPTLSKRPVSNSWAIQLFLIPSHVTLWVAIATVAMCSVLTMIVIGLHVKEKVCVCVCVCGMQRPCAEGISCLYPLLSLRMKLYSDSPPLRREQCAPVISWVSICLAA